MTRDRKILQFLIVSCLLISPAAGHAGTVTPQVCDQGQCVNVEVVSKQEDLERGLMYRSGMPADHGMLFVFGFDDYHQFWMKNMQFNLDMLWIDADGHIVFLSRNVLACTNDPCPVYTPDHKARYVLELNSGYTLAHNWVVGDKLDLKGI